MIKILFVCHGNICRSPMAQFVLQDMVNKAGISDKFYIDSAATSTEEIGNPPHRGTVKKMREMNIPVLPHRAVQLKKSDYEKYDYIIGMDEWNLRNIMRILGSDPEGKVSLLLEHTDRKDDIADPWYTGNFDVTYDDIEYGCKGLLREINDKNGELF
ncbi:MAG: low molecular weight phosphotyrosine protein phosphatase [Lachnospiraceae bacterium]|nr:low molecular weight phosphotyrosine protein phosphatase [Lachnospiraceae bacterium]